MKELLIYVQFFNKQTGHFECLCINHFSMKTSEYIEDKINKLPRGYVFTYRDFISEVTRREAIIKHLNRMAVSGKISKLSKGKYFKPQETVFGTLLPDQHQIVKDLLEEDGKLVGYIKGYSV